MDFVQEYVREEIRGEAAVRNLSAFLRFLPAAALAHGHVVNVAALARDAAASRTTIDGYLAVLRDTLMATLLPAFEPRLRVRERRHPKLYWTDAGVVRAVKQQLGEVAAEERGPLLEGLALTVLRAHNQRGDVFDDIGYWAPGPGARDRSGLPAAPRTRVPGDRDRHALTPREIARGGAARDCRFAAPGSTRARVSRRSSAENR